MRKFLISVLFLFLFCPPVFADDYLIPAPVVYTEFEIKDNIIKIAGLAKDLDINNSIQILACSITCTEDLCNIDGAQIRLVYGIPILKTIPLGFDYYTIVEKDNNHILAKLNNDYFAGDIKIDIKNKTAYISYTVLNSLPHSTQNYQILTNPNETDAEVKRLIKLNHVYKIQTKNKDNDPLGIRDI